MRTYSIKNFARYQHYTDRKPPWIKLYGDIWGDRAFFRLKPESKLLLIGLFTVASHCDNSIPDDPEWVAAELKLPLKLIDFSPLVAAGFLLVEQDASEPSLDSEQSASEALATCYPSRASVSVSVSNSVSEGECEGDGGFDAFYAAYPKRKDREKAVRAWRKLTPDERNAALADVPKRIASDPQWGDPQFIPMPSTYLNGKRWMDEIAARAAPNGRASPLPQPELRSAQDYENYLKQA